MEHVLPPPIALHPQTGSLYIPSACDIELAVGGNEGSRLRWQRLACVNQRGRAASEGQHTKDNGRAPREAGFPDPHYTVSLDHRHCALLYNLSGF